jgi:hypothetical protein
LKVLRGLALLLVLCCALPAWAADITDYFKLYYLQQVAPNPNGDVLDFLREGPDKALTASASRAVTIDRANGYLQVSDSAGTDQVLTMAVYHKADGSQLLVAGSSDCADACTFSVEFLVISGDRVRPVAMESVVPTIEPGRFIKPGRKGPGNPPKINYVPARLGTTLTLKPWYGYEVEGQMKKETRAAIQDVLLTWDRASGRFR